MPDLLFDRSKSFLAVIDVQPVFLNKLAPAASSSLVARIVWLIGVARELDIPVLAMAEDVTGNGLPDDKVRRALGIDATVHDKLVFGLCGQPDILAAVRALDRPQAILVGLETDVCVAQSALGLLGEGFRVAVASDATGSPGECHAAGLARMRDAGVVVTTVKGIFYEWVRNLETLGGLRSRVTKTLPDGLTL